MTKMEEEVIKKIIPLLESKGFKKVLKNSALPNIRWSFDLLGESEQAIIALEIRRNDKIPDILLERVKSITKYPKKLFIYLVFEKAPSNSVISMLSTYGIGTIVFQNNQLYFLAKSRDFSKKVLLKRVKKRIPIAKSPPEIWVYACSKQYEKDDKTPCKERERIDKIVREYNRIYDISINVHRIEKEHRGDKEFKIKIIEHFKKSQIFIGIINERYSRYIDYEIRNVFKYLNKEYILIYKKNMSETDIEKDELNSKKKKQKQEKQKELIKYIHKTDFLSYSKLSDLSDQIKKHLMEKIVALRKCQGFKLPFER